MTEAALVNRDKRGDWRPPYLVELPAPFAWPPQPVAVLKWLVSYVWPWNSLYLAIALVTWFFLTPSLASMESFEAWWIAIILARNAGTIFLVVGAWHLYFYIFKAQGTDLKYTDRPLAKNNSVFLFGDQVRDNMFWTFASAVPIWTAYEVVILWAYANGFVPFINWETNPVWFVGLLLLIPLIHDIHFYWIHRLIHWRPLYESVHHLHHRNVNIGPWSGVSMHPVEHVLYFSGILLYWLVAAHPIHAIFHIQRAAIAPAQGHSGFDRIKLGGDRSVAVGTYFHYLHHQNFECNYSGDGMTVFDKIFGTFHDGSDAAQERMNERFMRRMRGTG